jgi:cytochrome d ubiquinol oxidase subunit II
MEWQTLQVAWFVLYGVLLIGYAILDGFDLGIGALSLLSKDERERGLHMDAIAPVWDGNEVWLLAAGGSLFAAFPPVYATVFSGFYIPFFLLLAALIFRAVSFEFRNQVDSPRWRRAWDWAFGLGSLLPPILFGVAVGNVLRGLPIDARGEFAGTFLGLLNPYSIGVGVLVLVMFVTHGALYLAIKTEGALHDRMIRWAGRAWIGWAALWVAMTIVSFFAAPGRFAPGHPLFWVFLAGAVGTLASLPVLLGAGRLHYAFLMSVGAIACQTGLALVGLFPVLLPSTLGAGLDLTAYNASSSAQTLTVMLLFAGLGMPVVIGYTIWIFRVFRGKVVEGGGYH